MMPPEKGTLGNLLGRFLSVHLTGEWATKLDPAEDGA